MRKHFFIWLGSISLLLAVPLDVPTQAAEAMEAFSPQFGLLLGPREASAGRGRRGFGFAGASDPVRGRLIDGTLRQFAPEDGQALEGQEGWQWKRVEFDGSGTVRDRGSHLYAPVASEELKVLVLNTSSHSETYINGQPRGGDIPGGPRISPPDASDWTGLLTEANSSFPTDRRREP